MDFNMIAQDLTLVLSTLAGVHRERAFSLGVASYRYIEFSQVLVQNTGSSDKKTALQFRAAVQSRMGF